MVKRILAIAIIYLGAVAAWMALGGSLSNRTSTFDGRLGNEVASLWGAPQTQVSPDLVFTWQTRKLEKYNEWDSAAKKYKPMTKEVLSWGKKPVQLESSEIQTALKLTQRKKGLLWYPTYEVDFRGRYLYKNDSDQDGILIVTYRFPTPQASYDNLVFESNGKADPRLMPISDEHGKILEKRVPVSKGGAVPFSIGYQSRGLNSWRYSFGTDINHIKNFSLSMTTNFPNIDFPAGTISPTKKDSRSDGWLLNWNFNNLVSGFQIGMEMPQKLNPGPLAAQISYFAPVCLTFFFIWMFVITLLRNVELHPMNYLFLAAAFFAFHLLFAYTVDHIELLTAFAISSGVSIFLVVTYLRGVVGLRFAALEAGSAQVIYLILFSYAHFFEGYTGLIVTIGSIVTLFVIMQLTIRIRWSEKFKRAPKAVPKPILQSGE
jgi:hypothetical protein